MAKQKVEALIEGGKATAAPPLGPALGPLGVNIGQVIAEINKKTQSFKGMQVPVTVEVDMSTKAFEISIGTPPASALIKQEAGVKKGSGVPQSEFIADLIIEQVMKIAKMKEDALLGKDLKAKVKEIVGTCNSMGVKVEGVKATEALRRIEAGEFDKQILSGKTELSAEEKKHLDEEREAMKAELEKKHAEQEEKAKKIIAEMEGKDRKDKVAKLEEAEIPSVVINKLLPEDKEAKPAGNNPAENKK